MMLRLVVTDGKGLSAEATGMIVPCNVCPDQPPVVNFIEPSQKEYSIEKGRNTYLLPVTVSYSDDSAVKGLDLYINDQLYFRIDLDSKSGTMAISPDIAQIELSQGNYTLKAVVKDSCNQATEAVKTVEIKKEELPIYWATSNYGTLLVYYNGQQTISIGKYEEIAIPVAPPPGSNPPPSYTSYQYSGTLTKSQVVGSSPPADGGVIGEYRPLENKVIIYLRACSYWSTNGSAEVYWTIKPDIDYIYEFKYPYSGCCIYVNNVKVCS
jgi:hypothetical protein